MLEYLRLRNVGPAPEMEMKLAERLNVITGDNGLGKSFLLDVAWWALTRHWPAEVNEKLTSGQPARPAGDGPATISFGLQSKTRPVTWEATYNRREQYWKGKQGRPANPGLVIYAMVDGSFAVWDPARNYWKQRGEDEGQEPQPAYVFSPAQVWDGLPHPDGSKPLCNGLIADWAFWQTENGATFAHLRAALETMSPAAEERLAPGELVKLSIEDARRVPTLRMPYGVDVPIVLASAGMRRVVALVYLLLWSWEEHIRAAKLVGDPPTRQVTFLVDEIEGHLHPRWQRTVVRSLLNVMQNLAGTATVQVIAATHSPLVLASLEPLFDPTQDAWFDVDLVGQPPDAKVRLRRREFVRHGEVSNWLTSEAFDLKCARSLEGEAAIEKARALLREPSPKVEQARAIDQDLRRAGLPDIDPFWVRWGYFMERVGAAT
jgi:hypothetical protein